MAFAVVVVLAVALVASCVAVGALRGLLRQERIRTAELDASLATARDEAVAARDDAAAATADRDATAADVERLDALVRTLWSLELVRVAREWAVTGGGVSTGVQPVAADTGAELATAVRMELERRREESGIPGDLDASTSAAALGSVPVGTALGALRLVGEVVAAVSRPSEGLTVALRAGASDVVATITLDEADADVPSLLCELASGAGASIAVDGHVVSITVPC